MISYRHRPSSAAQISAISSWTFSASLRTGTTMETATAASDDCKSTLTVRVGGPQAARYPAGAASVSYGAAAPRANLLRRGGGSAARAAIQYRTSMAPTTPIKAPATTSLG